jgi:hypothetical protein
LPSVEPREQTQEKFYWSIKHIINLLLMISKEGITIGFAERKIIFVKYIYLNIFSGA